MCWMLQLDAYVLDVSKWMLMCWMLLLGNLLMCWMFLSGCLSDWIWAQGHC